MSYLGSLLVVPGYLIRFLRGARLQKAMLMECMEGEIRDIERVNDGSLGEKDFKKIRSYYGYAVAAVAGEGFCLLRGKPMTHRERSALTYLGAVTGLGDDFFDEKRASAEHIMQLIQDPREDLANSSFEVFAVRLWKKALGFVDDPEALIASFSEVYQAQINSIQQEDPKISDTDLRQITMFKGGSSIQFYRHAFSDPVTERERPMLFLLGGIGQLENDLFDVYKDLQDGIQTLVTREKNLDRLRKEYYMLITRFINGVNGTSYPAKGKKRFIEYSMLIMARGLVCLDYLDLAAKKSSGKFTPASYSRTDLVCDMGNIRNILKNLHYFAQLNTKVS